LYEMTNAEDDETACDGEFIPDLVMKSINDDGNLPRYRVTLSKNITQVIVAIGAKISLMKT
jgi:hypothetical protein